MVENELVLDSIQKNLFKINCEYCNQNAELIKNNYDLPSNLVTHGYGDINAKLVIVGEGPGKNGAAKTGIPFTRDESGKRLQLGLIRSQYSEGNENEVKENLNYTPILRDVFITNLFRFYGYKKFSGNLKKDLLLHSLNHLEFKINSLRKFNQIKLIAIGKTAYKNIENNISNSNVNKIEHPSTFNNKTREQWINIFLDCIIQLK